MAEAFDKVKKTLRDVLAATEEKIDKRMTQSRDFLTQVHREEEQLRDDLDLLRAERASLEEERIRVQQQLDEVAQVRAELEARRRGGLFGCCMSKPRTQVSDITVHHPDDEAG
mmetsp:Transcript_128141/g.370984  ORF Transcript_128141/g.370984 Transcript_128141/m.370984 type:complete len:113 (+) Transcript_128141:159-497(+)